MIYSYIYKYLLRKETKLFLSNSNAARTARQRTLSQNFSVSPYGKNTMKQFQYKRIDPMMRPRPTMTAVRTAMNLIAELSVHNIAGSGSAVGWVESAGLKT